MFLVYIERVKQAHAGGLAGVGVAIQTLYRSWGVALCRDIARDTTAIRRPAPCDMAQGRCDKRANARDMAQGRCDKRSNSRNTARHRDLCRDTILCHD